MRTASRPIILASTAMLSWSTVATAFKIALSRLTVFETVLIASFTALAIYTVFMFVTRSWGALRRIPGSAWGRFALLGLISPTAYYMMLFAAYDHLPAQIAQPVNYIWPILLTLLLAVIGHKQIPVSNYLGMAISLTGVVAISMGGTAISGSISLIGVALALGSALLWALFWIVNDSLKPYASEEVSLFLTFLFGALYLTAATPFMPMTQLTLPSLLSGMYIGVFEMGLPFICFGLAIRHADNPAIVNQICYLSPFLSLFIISMVLGESIMPTTYIGLALIVGGLVSNQYIDAVLKRTRHQKA